MKAQTEVLMQAIQGEKEVLSVSSGQVDTLGKPQIVVDKGETYTRATHPMLFEVIDLLDENAELKSLSVRELAKQAQAGKSWCAVAKRYWLSIERM